MSSIHYTLGVTPKSEKQVVVLARFFDSFDPEKENYEDDIQHLKKNGFDAKKLLHPNLKPVGVESVATSGKTLIIEFVGGTISSPEFKSNLVEMLLQSKPVEIILVAFNDQVGEYEVDVFAQDEHVNYQTDMGGEIDDEIMDLADEPVAMINEVRHLYQQGQLKDTAENDEDLDYKLGYVVAPMISLVYSIPIVLIGWLVFGALKTSLIVAGVAALIYTIIQWLAHYGRHLRELEELTDSMVNEAKAAGFNDKEQLEHLRSALENAMKVSNDETAKKSTLSKHGR